MTIEDISVDNEFNIPEKEPTIIKVIGVGGGGNNAVKHMYEQNVKGISFVVCNTDNQALTNSPVPLKLMIGPEVTKGLGAGNKPDVARQAAEESVEDIRRLFDDSTRMVFITAGMGGGTGTGAAPIVAREAKASGLLTIGIVTIPFLFEGKKKILKALDGADEMSKYVDALLVVNNERLTEIYPDTDFMNAFRKADDTLSIAALGISEMITTDDGVINIDFNDVNTTLRNGGAAIISIGYGEGEHRLRKAIEDALRSPLLRDHDIQSSKRILFNIYYNPDAETPFVMNEVKELTDFTSRIYPGVDVIWGLAYDRKLGNKIKITLLAAGFDALPPENLVTDETAKPDDTYVEPPLTIEDSNAQDDKDTQRIQEQYGTQKVDVLTGAHEQQKQIILRPDQFMDDDVIEALEKNPTYTREASLAEKIRKKPEGNPSAAATDNDPTSSGKEINFTL